MIIVWGPASDEPVAAVHDALVDRGADVVHVDVPELTAMQYEVELGVEPSGWLVVGGRRIDLGSIEGVYLRPGRATEGTATAASAMLGAVSASLPAVVVNRPWAGRSNWSKPAQLRAIAGTGLRVPDTIATTDPDVARAFMSRHGRIVYKSVSGVRSIVATLDESESARLDEVGHGPTQFQQWVDGLDVRVHVVGDRWFATAIESDGAADYRYAAATGPPPTMAPTLIPDELGDRLVELSRSMGLCLSGVDLRVNGDGWWCFEVNPSPGFTYYEAHTDQPITDAVASLLMGSLRRSQERGTTS